MDTENDGGYCKNVCAGTYGTMLHSARKKINGNKGQFRQYYMTDTVVIKGYYKLLKAVIISLIRDMYHF